MEQDGQVRGSMTAEEAEAVMRRGPTITAVDVLSLQTRLDQIVELVGAI